MFFEDVVKTLELSNFASEQLKELEDKNLCAQIKMLDTLKLYTSEFLELKDLKEVNKNSTLRKNVCFQDKKVDIIVQNLRNQDLQICRFDSYRNEKSPFFRIGMNVVKNKVFFALYQAKHDKIEESCYMFTYDNSSKLTKAEIIENGKKEIVELAQAEI